MQRETFNSGGHSLHLAHADVESNRNTMALLEERGEELKGREGMIKDVLDLVLASYMHACMYGWLTWSVMRETRGEITTTRVLGMDRVKI